MRFGRFLLAIGAVALLPLIAMPLRADLTDDALILPGERVGLINATTTERDLMQLLPVGQVRRTLRWIGDGFYRCATEAFVGTDRALAIFWENASDEVEDDSEATRQACEALTGLARPVLIEISGEVSPFSPWRTRQGIGIGGSLGDLARLTRDDIAVSACPCEFGGILLGDTSRLPEGLGMRVYVPWDIERSPDEFDPDYTLYLSQIPPEHRAGFVITNLSVLIH